VSWKGTFVKKKTVAWILGLGLMTLTLAVSAACGESAQGADPANGKPDVVIGISLKNLRFTPPKVEVPAGKTVRINVTNLDGTEHDLLVNGLRIEKVGAATGAHHAGATPNMLVVHVTANGTGSITFRTDQKGTFVFNCTIPGHKDAGMVGEMTVS
jgi:uncharacterized cupredoxin-like copper-binding protein